MDLAHEPVELDKAVGLKVGFDGPATGIKGMAYEMRLVLQRIYSRKYAAEAENQF